MKHIPVLLLTFLLAICSCSLHAQSVKFYTQLSAGKVGIQDQLQVSYVLENGESITGIHIPDFGSFKIISGPHRSSNTRINVAPHGTEQTSSVTLSFVVQPGKIGRFTLPALFVKTANGQTYKSQQAQVEVVEGSAVQQRRSRSEPFADDDMDEFINAIQRQHQQMMQAMQQQLNRQHQQYERSIDDYNDLERNLFLQVVVDKTKVYEGEQIIAAYKLYARVPMQMGISKMPSLNGFWTQDFKLPKEIKPVREVYNGKEYDVFTLKKSALFPQQTGKLLLDQAEAQGVAQQIVKSRPNDPYGYFDDVFGGTQVRDVPVHLKSKEVPIQVMSLPTNGKPNPFSGAVGKYTTRLSVDKTSATTDEVITLTYTISGSGNLKLITPPELLVQDGLTVLDPMVVDTINSSLNSISGHKTITYVITPLEPGHYKLPPLTFSFFNPATGQYETLVSQSIDLNISKGALYKDQLREKDAPIKQQIRPLITGDLPEAQSPFVAFINTTVFRMLLLLPLLAILFFETGKKRKQNRIHNLSGYKWKAASKVALKRLKQAKLYLSKNNKDPFYEEITKALWLYISDKTALPLAELNKEKGLEALQNQGISETLINDVAELSDTASEALYAPNVNGKMQNDYQKAVIIIGQLESEWKTKEKNTSATVGAAGLLVLLSLSWSTYAQTPKEEWAIGIQAYNEQNYVASIVHFENAAEMQPNNASIWYDLGNAYFKNNQFPLATLAYKRSLLFQPQLEDAQYNLRVAQSRIQGIKPLPQKVFFERWWAALSQQSLSNYWAIAGLILLFAAAYLYFLKRTEKLKFIFTTQLLLTVLLITGLCLFLAWKGARQHQGAKDAVVMVDKTTLLAPNKTDKTLLVAGTIVTIQKVINDEVQVTTADGQKGWVTKKSLSMVQP